MREIVHVQASEAFSHPTHPKTTPNAGPWQALHPSHMIPNRLAV